jgi:hypothetical protein
MLRAALKVVPLLALAVLAPRPAHACAMALGEGRSARIDHEEALIVWDGRMQHFIRRAGFTSSANDIGFIVPTPSRPEVDELGEKALGRFEALLDEAQKPVAKLRLRPTSMFIGPGLSASASTLGSTTKKHITHFGAVTVFEEKRVAGFDVAVLEADDPEALRAWLEAHDYSARPALIEWLKPYIARRWKLTAFKLARNAYDEKVDASAVRLSFPTARPFYPYREPADTDRSRPRTLRVYFVGPSRMDGVLGARLEPWGAEVKLARKLSAPGPLLAEAVPAGTLGEGAWLTIFEDDSRQRVLGEELDFQPSASPQPYEPPRPVFERTVLVPLEFGLTPLALVGLVWFARRRRLGTVD